MRLRNAVISFICLSVMALTPAAAFASGGTSTTSTSLTQTAPSRLTNNGTQGQGNLPFTGLNLLPESVAAIVLILGGAVMLRWRPRSAR